VPAWSRSASLSGIFAVGGFSSPLRASMAQDILIAVPLVLNHEFAIFNLSWQGDSSVFLVQFSGSAGLYRPIDISDLATSWSIAQSVLRPLAAPGSVRFPRCQRHCRCSAFLLPVVWARSLPPLSGPLLSLYCGGDNGFYTFVLKRKACWLMFHLAGSYQPVCALSRAPPQPGPSTSRSGCWRSRSFFFEPWRWSSVTSNLRG